jgi:2'-5' RNA ligase
MRGFFAFAVRDAFALELERAARSLPASPKLTPLLPADYHVTIKFLSEFSSTNFFACLPELCALGAPPADSLRAGKLALWPTVLALECEPTPALVAWHLRVNVLLERRGFIKERHARYNPHVTLARRKEGWRLPEVEAALALSAEKFRGAPVPVEPPVLWRTQPDGTGRRHLPLLSPLLGRDGR